MMLEWKNREYSENTSLLAKNPTTALKPKPLLVQPAIAIPTPISITEPPVSHGLGFRV